MSQLFSIGRNLIRVANLLRKRVVGNAGLFEIPIYEYLIEEQIISHRDPVCYLRHILASPLKEEIFPLEISQIHK